MKSSITNHLQYCLVYQDQKEQLGASLPSPLTNPSGSTENLTPLSSVSVEKFKYLADTLANPGNRKSGGAHLNSFIQRCYPSQGIFPSYEERTSDSFSVTNEKWVRKQFICRRQIFSEFATYLCEGVDTLTKPGTAQAYFSGAHCEVLSIFGDRCFHDSDTTVSFNPEWYGSLWLDLGRKFASRNIKKGAPPPTRTHAHTYIHTEWIHTHSI